MSSLGTVSWRRQLCCVYVRSTPLSLQETLALRDAEVKRLAAASAQGPDVDRLAQQYRNNANEAVILQLNQQVGLPLGKCINA